MRTPMLFLATLGLSLLATTSPARADSVVLDELATGLPSPLGIVNAGDGSGRLFVVLQPGSVRIWTGTELFLQPFLDIEDRVQFSGEQGLLGLAFHPDYATNGELFVTYTNVEGNSVIARYRVTSDPDLVDPDSEEILLTIEQPFGNHNAGQLAFGPDGFLYIATGDGGSANDPDNRAQNLTELLGKLLRIDVDGGTPYAIPPDNPFVGHPGVREEIWAYGLRNPWRFSFDRENGDLFIGDVGQNEIEEVDLQRGTSMGGENYGWRLMEGSACFDPPAFCDDGTLTLPILEYAHLGDSGFNCSIIGGYRYRGGESPGLGGIYLYGDFCSGNIWGGIEQVDGSWIPRLLAETTSDITSFGEDETGELYMVEGSGGFYRLRGLPRLFCDVAMSQNIYAEGDTVTIATQRIGNPMSSGVQTKVSIAVHRASGTLASPVTQVETRLSAGATLDLGIEELILVAADTPRGDYSVVCRLTNMTTGTQLFVDKATFTIE